MNDLPKTVLVLVAAADLSPEELERVRTLLRAGATVVAWQHKPLVQDRFPCPDVEGGLSDADIPHSSLGAGLSESLGGQADWALDEAVIHWFKELGTRPVFGGKSFRERFHLGGLRLWWWAELYLYHETPLRAMVRDVEALHHWIAQEQPEKIVLVRPSESLERATKHLALAVETIGALRPRRVSAGRTTRLFLSDWLKMLGTGLKSLTRVRPRWRRDPNERASKPGASRVFFLTHGSMWRMRRDPETGRERNVEMYFDEIIPRIAEEAEPVLVAFGPPVPFKQFDASSRLSDLLELTDENRRASASDGRTTSNHEAGETERLRAIREYFSFTMSLRLSVAFWRSLRMWSRLTRSEHFEDLESWLTHHGVRLGEEASLCVRDTFFRQFPWAVRAYREVASVLEKERPDIMVLYAESSGLGRAAIQAARDRGIPSMAVQHGIMYPQYFSHEHTEEEIEGSGEEGSVPIPDITTVFGALASELLRERSHYPPGRIRITGSPKFDGLVRAAEKLDRTRLRQALGIENVQCLVLATRFSAVEAVLVELIESVESLEGVRLLIKPHQAESVTPYVRLLEDLSPESVELVSGESHLLELLVATDALVTVDSLASSEALVLGRPVMVINLPSNLETLVDRGCALGVFRGEPIRPAIDRLFHDETRRAELASARERYLRDFAFGADGRSTERIVDAIRETIESG